MKTVDEILEPMSDEEKLHALKDFVSAYQPWAILFEEFVNGWLLETRQADAVN